MALINRISRLFKADLHAVLDHIEEPEMLLKQSIREMEEETRHSEQQLEFLSAELENLKQRREGIERVLQEIQQKIDLCFESEQEDLVRGLVKKQLENIRFRELLEQRQRLIEKETDKQRKQLSGQQTALESMRQKAELFCPNADCNSDAVPGKPDADFIITDEEVEIALLREKKRRQQS